jgi:hypothetical protein
MLKWTLALALFAAVATASDPYGHQSKAFVGDKAPEFTTKAVLNGEFIDIKLSDYRGKWLVFFFYPLDFTCVFLVFVFSSTILPRFVCPTEIIEFSERADEFDKLGAAVVGASVDSLYSLCFFNCFFEFLASSGILHGWKCLATKAASANSTFRSFLT